MVAFKNRLDVGNLVQLNRGTGFACSRDHGRSASTFMLTYAHLLTKNTKLSSNRPAYLFTHATGRKYKEKTSHFDPKAPLFDKKDRADVLLSDIMLLSVIAVLAFTGYVFVWFFFCLSKPRREHCG